MVCGDLMEHFGYKKVFKKFDEAKLKKYFKNNKK